MFVFIVFLDFVLCSGFGVDYIDGFIICDDVGEFDVVVFGYSSGFERCFK